ncbi:MAG TPA: hypothetical protein PK812_03115 [Beijerinckiaceae bacterium]|nr:hypothetical protein [Beijerinckiaceae bacterium]
MAEPGKQPEGIVLTEEQKRKQRRRSVALALCIGGLVVLFYLITVVKLGPGILVRKL